MRIIEEIGKQLQPFADDFSLDNYLLVSLSAQKLWQLSQGKVQASYTVSTSSKGAGNQQGSGKTPLGVHCIAEKIGDNAAIGTLFKCRQDMGETAPILSRNTYSDIDAITSRILWLKGLQPGINQGEGIDSYQRYIYIHGTDEEWRLGTAASHGCIRMSNQDVIMLYDKVCVNTLVVIIE